MIEEIKEFLYNYRRHFWHSFYYWLGGTNCETCPYHIKAPSGPGGLYDWDCVNYTSLTEVLK